MKIIGIYRIINLITNISYVGQSIDCNHRWNTHKNDLNNFRHKNLYLQRAWLKYGEQNFKFEVIEKCNIEDLNTREQFWLDFGFAFNNLYNMAVTAENLSGYKQRKEHIDKRIFTRRSNGNFKHSEETKEKIRNKLVGKSISEETRAKMSASRKGKRYRLGTKASEKTKELLRITSSNRKHLPETIEKCRQAKLGHSVSQETRAKISQSLLARNAL